jgi:glutamate-1-semialdehyde aminotransferase
MVGLPVCPQMIFTPHEGAGDSSRRDPGAYQTELFRGLYHRGIIPYPVMYESVAHTDDEIDYAVNAFSESLREAYRT